MLLLIIFAFLAGLVTILSPCILPLLPIVLSGSIDNSKRRPFGIVAGFILSFTFFTLFLSSIVQATGIPSDILRNISIAILFLFGLTLLLPQAQYWLERFSGLVTRFVPQEGKRSGWWGGVVIGLSLGLLWTPCVGPIMASIIALAATSTVTAEVFFITLAYSLGTAIPMFAVIYGGRQLLQKMGLMQKAALIQKVFGVLMLLTALAIFFNIDRSFQTYILTKFPQYGTGLTSFEDTNIVKQRLTELQKTKDSNLLDTLTGQNPAPEFIAGGQWFNSSPLTLKGLKGKVVLVDFWTYTCINCIRTLPYIESWYNKYKDKGFVVVGVHTPEFTFEKNTTNVARAIKYFGLTYPIVQDNNYAIWTAYGNHYWPAKYLIDQKGVIRWQHFGEGNYDESEQMIQKLLKENGQSVDQMPIANPTYSLEAKTPELYLGFAKSEFLVSPEVIQQNKTATYSMPITLPLNYYAFSGSWNISEEYATATSGSKLNLHFDARHVYLVMRSSQSASQINILLDGHPAGISAGKDVREDKVIVDSDREYELINMPIAGEHTITLDFVNGDVQVFAFTFG